MISDNTHRIQMPEGEVRELASPQGLLWERAVRELKSRLEQAYVTRNNGIKGLKAYGATPVKHKAEKLWGRYVPCEYINIPLGGYLEFDVTNTQDTRWLADMKYIPAATPQDYPWIGGFRTYVNDVGIAKHTIELAHSALTIYLQYGSTEEHSVRMSSPFSQRDRHTYEWNANEALIDGTVISTETAETFVGTDKLKIGAVANSTGFRASFSGNCYRVQCWKDGVNQDIDAIPVKDVVSNVYGLWDRVEGKFYGNAGSGAFTGGELIQPVAYAESTGTQYFDTNFRRTSGNAYKAEVNVEPTGAGSFFTLGADYIGYVIKKYSDGTVGMSATLKLSDDNTRKIYTIELAADGINSVLTTPAGSISNTRSNANYGYNVNIGRAYVDDYGKAKYYGVKLLENSTLVRDYLPVRIGTTVELLDLVSWTFATRVGTLTAGADIPYTQMCPDIIKVNTGDIRYGVGKNLFDGISNLVLHKYIAAETGEVDDNNRNFYCEDYFEIKPNTLYVFWGEKKSGGTLSKYNRIHFYDADKTFISTSPYPMDEKGVSISPANAKYARISCNPLNNKALMQSDINLFNWYFGEGTAATEYEPYRFGIHTDGEHKVIVKGKNLFDIAYAVWGYNIDENGNELKSQYNSHSDHIECKPNTTYTVSWISNFDSGVITRYHEYDENKTWLRQIITYNSSSRGKYSVTFTTGETAQYIRFTFRGRSINSDDLSTNIQLEEGTATTPYEPYIAPQIRDIPMLLSAESNLDIQSGTKTEAWGIKVIDGTESGWQKISGNNVYYIASDEIKACNPPENGLSTHFVGTNAANASMPDYSVKNTYAGSGSGQIGAVSIKINSITTVDDFKAYLASEYAKGTPVIILYPLATPITEQVTIAPVTSQRRTTYVADSDSELGKTSLELDFLGKYGTPQTFLTSDGKRFILSDGKIFKVQV